MVEWSTLRSFISTNIKSQSGPALPLQAGVLQCVGGQEDLLPGGVGPHQGGVGPGVVRVAQTGVALLPVFSTTRAPEAQCVAGPSYLMPLRPRLSGIQRPNGSLLSSRWLFKA